MSRIITSVVSKNSAANPSLCDLFGRSCGCLINALPDATRHQGRVSLPWRLRVPSRSGLVSFQGTCASREGETDLQDANAQEGWKGLAGDGRQFSPDMGPPVFGQGGPLAEMAHGRLLLKK